MVNNPHPKRLGLLLQIPANAAHSQDTQNLALGVMAEHGRRLAAPLALAEGENARVEVAQGPDDQEHIDIGGGVVDSRGGVGDEDWGFAETAGVDIYLVIAGAWILSGMGSRQSETAGHTAVRDEAHGAW